ncbi:hypothetical protein B0H63DRAFT_473209 [Podospora didyma]|uniref:Uncharacterized protein n=1 Tax=Podospora didyma TaxID=330526 RepID=A0AAE0NQ29_9PEZI|nr:hypothetical protein B0H63DRAFT_473209 [Podospora didyma]
MTIRDFASPPSKNTSIATLQSSIETAHTTKKSDQKSVNMSCCTVNQFNKIPGGGPSSGSGAQPKRVARRQAFYNPVVRDISFKIQNPRFISFRDVVITIFSLYALFKAWVPLQILYHATAVFVMKVLSVAWEFAGAVVPWGITAVAVVFSGEEVIRRWKAWSK